MNLTLNGIKTFNGNEGPGFSATLYIDGRKAGEVVDDANGSEYRYHVSREDHEALLKFAATLPQDLKDGEEPFRPETWARVALDSIVGKLVDDTESEKRLKRHCSASVCYRLKGDEKGTFLKIAPVGGKKRVADWDAWVAKTIEKIRVKHGDKVEVIYNEKHSKVKV